MKMTAPSGIAEGDIDFQDLAEDSAIFLGSVEGDADFQRPARGNADYLDAALVI